MELDRRGIDFSKDLPRVVTISTGQTTQLDFGIDTGIRRDPSALPGIVRNQRDGVGPKVRCAGFAPDPGDADALTRAVLVGAVSQYPR